MNDQWQAISGYIDARNERERIILMLVFVALVYFIVDLIWLSGALEKRQQLQSRLERLENDNSTAELQVQALQSASTQIASRNAEERQQLVARLDILNQKLASTASGFIPAELMPEVLEKILREQGGLKLIALENSQPKIVSAANDRGSQFDSDSEDASVLYQHGVSFQLEGSYHSSLEYLQKLEALPWHLDWRSMEYEVDDYPSGRLNVEIYTYSTDREWLGV